MDIRRIKARIPEGFQVRSSGKKICIFREFREKAILALAEEGEIARRTVDRLRGRGRPSVIESDGEKLVVRHYYHGGIFRKLTGDFFFRAGRFLNELALLESARRGGTAVPRAAGLLIEPAFPFLCRADLVTVYLPESLDLLSCYQKTFAGDRVLPPEKIPAIIAAAGRQTALLHRAGILHGDLQVKNILVRPDCRPPEVMIIDLDRGRRGRAGREQNLRRLYRSFLKLRLSLPAVSRYDPIRFLRAYAPQDRDFRRRMMAGVQRRRWLTFARLLKWKLSFCLRGGYYARSMEGEKRGAVGN
ncbi:MAG: lipopolysaccharide kinase InaA family protein [Candidatus Erginobacter occultus]|nr:lipopolysaccharide kinase InaA family protein [Candidatus Erginobacter occultus]